MKKIASVAILVLVLLFLIVSVRALLFGPRKPDVRSAAYLDEIADVLTDRLKYKYLNPEAEFSPAGCVGQEALLVCTFESKVHLPPDADVLLADVRAQMQGGACRSSLLELLKQGVTLRYSYNNKDGKPLVSFDTTSTDCATYLMDGSEQEVTRRPPVGKGTAETR